MITVQMTLDEDLVARVDALAKRFHMSRSAFTREALRHELELHTARRLEERHAAGYSAAPTTPGEFDDWEDEQSWGDQ